GRVEAADGIAGALGRVDARPVAPDLADEHAVTHLGRLVVVGAPAVADRVEAVGRGVGVVVDRAGRVGAHEVVVLRVLVDPLGGDALAGVEVVVAVVVARARDVLEELGRLLVAARLALVGDRRAQIALRLRAEEVAGALARLRAAAGLAGQRRALVVGAAGVV